MGDEYNGTKRKQAMWAQLRELRDKEYHQQCKKVVSGA